jgi:hypothetical protein
MKQGLPMGAVKNAMQRDGLESSIMDLDPEKSVASQLKKERLLNTSDELQENGQCKRKCNELTTKQLKKPNVRRKKIYWSPIEESKIDDNSLWSMIKGEFDFESLKVDQDEFESLFTDTSNLADKKKVVLDKPKEVKQKKSVQVIDAKRGMNGGIILARIKVDYAFLAEMVNEM